MVGPTESALSWEPVVYWVDADDVIRGVNDAWGRFALANDAPDLAEGVLGSSLWKYIAGREVRHIYQGVFKRVRAERCNVSFPFRCDSPKLHREMQLFVTPQDHGRIELRAEFGAIHAQPHPLALLAAGTHTPTPRMLRMCSWCKGISVNSVWTPLETAIEQLGLMTQPTIPSFTHGICDECTAKYAQDFYPSA